MECKQLRSISDVRQVFGKIYMLVTPLWELLAGMFGYPLFPRMIAVPKILLNAILMFRNTYMKYRENNL